MASQPQGLLQQLLRQVQSLFDVPQLEQLPAAMNKVRVLPGRGDWCKGGGTARMCCFWCLVCASSACALVSSTRG